MNSDTRLRETPAPTPSGPSLAPRLGLNAAQVGGSALAAATSALAASAFGVGGTLTGAAVGSVVSTVGGAIYVHSLQNVSRRTRTIVTRGRATPESFDPGAVPVMASAPVPSGPAPAASTSVPGAQAPTAAPAGSIRGLGWRPVAGLSVAAFVIALAGITGSELLLGHPISDASESGTTLTRVVDTGSTPSTTHSPTPTPSSSAPTSASTPTPTGTGTPSPTAPTSQPGVPTSSGSPTAPTGAPSTAPTGSPSGTAPAGAPSQAPSAGVPTP
jgi:hypothetical protein